MSKNGRLQTLVFLVALVVLTKVTLVGQTGSASNAPSDPSQALCATENCGEHNSSVVCKDAEQADSNLAKAKAKSVNEQLERLGNIRFVFKFTQAGARVMCAAQAKGGIYLEVENSTPNIELRYLFPGETEFQPFPGKRQGFIPENVHMILVDIIWCNVSCSRLSGSETATTICNMKVSVSNTSQDQGPCEMEVVFTRDLISSTGELLPAFIVSRHGLTIPEALLQYSRSDLATYTLNGTPVRDYVSLPSDEEGPIETPTPPFIAYEPISGWNSDVIRSFHIDRYDFVDACRLYTGGRQFLDVKKPGLPDLDMGKDNGIRVAPSKVFDTFTLRQMLATTASQLAAISGFNQSPITGALGNLQGITRDTSFLSAQVTTVPTPTVSSTAVNGSNLSNTLTNSSTLTNGQTGSTTTLICPPGTLPAIGTGGIPACALLTNTTIGPQSGGINTLNNTGSNLTSTLGSTNTGVQGSNQQNTVTTTTAGQAGAVAPAPASTALPAPTNVGVSASDVLAEQVQLNSQITTLRLLLQGAISDQYLVKESRAIATRQQTTVGFGISLNTPQRYRHAVAEVRVFIESPEEVDPVSVMNLLPADKTYNVAKITSNQKAFGGGAVVEAVNVGVSTGRSKDRLYIVKDTDTVALQFPKDKSPSGVGAEPLGRSLQEHIRDVAREALIWQRIDDQCADPDVRKGTTVFGWQFRPVLGGDYVEAGQRWVYAQLALPVSLGGQFTPTVHIQTRWREYDPKRRVVGAVYKGSCSISVDSEPIQVISPLRVHEVTVSDMGSGVLKVMASGNFFSAGFSVLSGTNTILPTTFDGKSVQLFANAANLLMADDLKLVAEDGQPTSLGMGARFRHGECGISHAKMTAVPRPDGNSIVELNLTSGPRYSLQFDKDPHPLILIGNQVFGLHETPFIVTKWAGDSCAKNETGAGITCRYHFLAPTNALRSAESFTVRDLAWREFKKTGTIDFDPSFTSLTILGAKPATAGASFQPLYTLAGFEFDKLRSCTFWHLNRCLEVFRGLTPVPLDYSNFQVDSKTTAVIKLPAADSSYDYKSLRIIWHLNPYEGVEWDLSIPQETKALVTASSILNVGDSMQLTFSGVELMGNPLSVLFDNTALDTNTYKYDSGKKALTVLITTAMTSKPGHKELTLTDSILGADGKPKQIQLPFDVTRR